MSVRRPCSARLALRSSLGLAAVPGLIAPARRPARRWVALLATAAVAAGMATFVTVPTAVAQGGPQPWQAAPPPGAGQPPPPPPPKPPAAKPPASPAVKPPASGDSALRQRMDGLEAQVVDIQVAIGTLESLARSGVAPAVAATAATGASEDGGRVAGLEAQVRTLTQQVQQLAEQVRALGGQPGANPAAVGAGGAPLRRSDAGAGSASPPGWGAAPTAGGPAAAAGGLAAGGLAAGGAVAVARADPRAEPPRWRGSEADIQSGALPPIPGASSEAATGPGVDPTRASLEAATPKDAYEAAYQHILAQDYGAAEVAFGDFLQRYPKDALAGDAQFWLGEAHFARNDYKSAANAFLKMSKTYGRNAKAPESLLKLAMSLSQLGQTEAACSSLAELGRRFPRATADVKTRAADEKQAAGCP